MDNAEKLMDTMESLIQMLNDTELAIPSIKQGINPDAYYTVKELSEVLSVSTRTIQSWRDTKQIIYIQIKLQKAILTLPEKQQLVFKMRYFEEIKYQEMSTILGTSVGALKASYHLAVKKIEIFMTKD